jgi:hypothetical protein
MKASDEIDITGDIVASSFCNAKLNINKDVVIITPNLKSYFFELRLHIFFGMCAYLCHLKFGRWNPTLIQKPILLLSCLHLGDPLI